MIFLIYRTVLLWIRRVCGFNINIINNLASGLTKDHSLFIKLSALGHPETKDTPT